MDQSSIVIDRTDQYEARKTVITCTDKLVITSEQQVSMLFLFWLCVLLRFLEVVASVDVHSLDHGPMWNLQGGQTQGKVRLPRQNNLFVCVYINTYIK